MTVSSCTEHRCTYAGDLCPACCITADLAFTATELEAWKDSHATAAARAGDLESMLEDALAENRDLKAELEASDDA